MKFCRDCKWHRRPALTVGIHLCLNPAVRAYHASPVEGVPPDVLCEHERRPYSDDRHAWPCGPAGRAFERRNPSLVYRFFLWLFGGPAR